LNLHEISVNANTSTRVSGCPTEAQAQIGLNYAGAVGSRTPVDYGGRAKETTIARVDPGFPTKILYARKNTGIVWVARWYIPSSGIVVTSLP
jgi:hypothetical protein